VGYDDDYRDGRYYGWHHRVMFRTLAGRCLTWCGLGAGAQVLDVGCGEGTVSECFARRGLDVFGADTSRVGVRIAAERARGNGYVYPRYAVADVWRLPVRAGAFDMVYTRSFPPLMEMLSRGDDAAVAGLTRTMLACCRPGGWLCISLPIPKPANRSRYGIDFRDTSHAERAWAPFDAEVYLLNRLDMFVLGKRAFSGAVSRLNRWWLRVAPRGGEIVVFIRKDAPA